MIQPSMGPPTSASQHWYHLLFGRDTDQQAARLLVEGIRRQSFAVRAESVLGINRLVGQMAIAGAGATG